MKLTFINPVHIALSMAFLTSSKASISLLTGGANVPLRPTLVYCSPWL